MVDAPPELIASNVNPVDTPPPPDAPPVGSPWPRRARWTIGIIVTLMIGLQLTAGFPERWVADIGSFFAAFEDWVIQNNDSHWLFTVFLNPLKDGIGSLLEAVTNTLLRMTWIGVIVTATAIAGLMAGWRKALLAFVGFLAIGMFGLWEFGMETLALMLVAVAVALVIGLPLGVWAGRSSKIDRVLRPVLDGMQTIPAYSYLLPLVLLFSIGDTTAFIAVVIFALPPVVRLTSLGMHGVAETSMEVADSFGATSRQRLFKVQLPLAKPSIMLGVNQTIMMALGMVVIAAVVGARGLGREVYNGLQHLDVGQALNGGLTIVILAIVLDRVSYGWSARDSRMVAKGASLLGRHFSRRTIVIAAIAISVGAIFLGRNVLTQQEFPGSATVSVADPTNASVTWLEDNLSGATGAVSDATIRLGLDPIRDLLLGLPWWMVCGGAALLAWQVSRRMGLAIMSFLCLAAIGVLGMWDIAMDTLSQVIVGVVIAVVIAVPLGIAAARSDRFQKILRPFMDAMQTLPAFVYLVPVVALFNVGRVPGVIAAVIYSLPPCIRLTDLGIRGVNKETVEAARSFGSTSWQTLRKIQLPLARPSILLGINQTIMMVLSVVIIAGLIGGGGLGLEVIFGLTHSEIGRGVTGGICIMLLAIVIDRITQAMGMAPRTLRGPVGTGLGWWPRVRAIGERSSGTPIDGAAEGGNA